jgi:hypothetical protein
MIRAALLLSVHDTTHDFRDWSHGSVSVSGERHWVWIAIHQLRRGMTAHALSPELMDLQIT